MKRFCYVAYDEEGKRQEGELVFRSKEEALQEIYDREWHLVKLEEKIEGKSYRFWDVPFHSRRKWILLATEWASLLEAGLTVTESLHLIENHWSPKEKKGLAQIRHQIATGHTVWDSFLASGYFPPFFISLLQVGEMTGTLPRELMRIASYYEKEDAFVRKIVSTLAYPLLVFLFAMVVLVTILTFVLPSFELLFETLQIDLPAGAHLALEVGLFLKKWGFELSILFFVSLLMGGLWVQTKKGKRYLSYMLYHRLFYRRILLSRFCLTMAAFLESGKPISESLADTEKMIGNEKAAQAIRFVKEEVQKGNPLAASLSKSGFSMSIVTELCEVGMDSGELPQFLSKAAYFLNDETERKLHRFQMLLEPCLLLFVGAITALVLFSVMLPVFQVAGKAF